MDFSWAIHALKQGQKVTRKIWAGDPSYIELTEPGSNSIIAVDDDTQVENWLCLHSDIFADDWEEYKDVEVKLPKAGSMENCEKLSNAINQLLDSIGVMPHLTVTLVPGPEDKELLISIEERSDHGAANYPLHIKDILQDQKDTNHV